jgi:hypothetical protein
LAAGLFLGERRSAPEAADGPVADER